MIDGDRITKLTREGLSAAAIGKILGINARTVVYARTKHGCSQNPPSRLTEQELQLAKNLLEDGASYTEVAKTLNRDRNNLVHRFPGYGWTETQAAQHMWMLKELEKI
jgi:hypothetical protein